MSERGQEGTSREGCAYILLFGTLFWVLIAMIVITLVQVFETNSDLAVGALDALGSHRDIDPFRPCAPTV